MVLWNDMMFLDYGLAMLTQLITQETDNKHARLTATKNKDQASHTPISLGEVIPDPAASPCKQELHHTLTSAPPPEVNSEPDPNPEFRSESNQTDSET